MNQSHGWIGDNALPNKGETGVTHSNPHSCKFTGEGYAEPLLINFFDDVSCSSDHSKMRFENEIGNAHLVHLDENKNEEQCFTMFLPKDSKKVIGVVPYIFFV